MAMTFLYLLTSLGVVNLIAIDHTFQHQKKIEEKQVLLEKKIDKVNKRLEPNYVTE